MTELAVKLDKTINAPVKEVFEAWLDPQTLSTFMTPLPGMPEPHVELDAREGGSFNILMKVEDEEISHHGEYLEIRPHSRLVFTWVSPFSTAGSTVTILFKALSDNRTQIELTHIKFKAEEERTSHEIGWANVLNKLDVITATTSFRDVSA